MNAVTDTTAAGIYQRHAAELRQQALPRARARTLRAMAAAAALMGDAAAGLGGRAAGAAEPPLGMYELSELLERLAWAELGQVVITPGEQADDGACTLAADPALTCAWTDLAVAGTFAEYQSAVFCLGALLAGSSLPAFALDKFFDAVERCGCPGAEPSLAAFPVPAAGIACDQLTAASGLWQPAAAAAAGQQ